MSCAAGSAVLQGAICGLASYFPTKYMQAIMTGQVSFPVLYWYRTRFCLASLFCTCSRLVGFLKDLPKRAFGCSSGVFLPFELARSEYWKTYQQQKHVLL